MIKRDDGFPKGFSFWVCLGKYAGWKVKKDGPSFRAVFGWVSVNVAWIDIEVQINRMTDLVKEAARENSVLYLENHALKAAKEMPPEPSDCGASIH